MFVIPGVSLSSIFTDKGNSMNFNMPLQIQNFLASAKNFIILQYSPTKIKLKIFLQNNVTVGFV
jgi:hypothetical protein